MISYNTNNEFLSTNNNLGAVYTPNNLAEYSAELLVRIQKCIWIESFKSRSKKDEVSEIDRLMYLENKLLNWVILDPSCGDGSLLMVIEKIISKELSNIRKQLLSYNIQNVNYPIQDSIEARCLGIDINKNAVIETIENLKDIKNSMDRRIDIKWADSLIPCQGQNFITGWSNLYNRDFSYGVVDAIIANPPWGANLQFSNEELKSAGYSLAIGQYDSYCLFVELSIKLAKEGAPLLFIIPDSIFAVEGKNLRKFLVDNTDIKFIARLGEKLFPKINRACSLILVVKQPPTSESYTKCFRLDYKSRQRILSGDTSFKQVEKELSHNVLQSRFSNDNSYNFDIDLRDNEINIINKIEKESIDWETTFESGRGVEISKKGNIIGCPECDSWQAPPRNQSVTKCNNCSSIMSVMECKADTIVAEDPSHNGNWVRFIVGENLKRYSIVEDRFLKLDIQGIKYKDPVVYRKPKILIRKTGLGINASIDYESNYLSQTIFYYSLIDNLQNKYYSLEYFLGVLNSRVMFYYYLKKYGELEWKSHVYLTQSTIKSLPIPKLTINNPDKIIIGEQISQAVSEIVNKEYSLEVDIKIEYLVARLYGLTNKEVEWIIKEINGIQDLSAINIMKIKNLSILPFDNNVF